ncbi:MAG TPA: hypothetical protein VMM13_00435, partial [Euzebya sp.]|nr:hypothetical protein [Euzebya sp.]
RFGHSLLRRVAYELIPMGRRQELHHAIGLLSADPSVRAHHLCHGMALDPHAAIAAMVAAGRASLAEQAYADAAEWFERAVEQSPVVGMSSVQVLDLRLEACDSARLAGRPGHAGPLLDLAEEAVETGHLDLRRRATVAAVQLGEAVDPGALQERAAQLADRAVATEEDRSWRARLNATGSILHSMSGDTPRCREMFLAALEDADPADDALACDVLPYAYMALGHPDDLALREALADRLLTAGLRLDDHAAQWEANHLRYSTAIMRADGRALRLALAECQRLLAHLGDAGRRWSVGYMRAALAAIDGRREDAERLSAEAMAVGTGVAPGRAMSVMSAQLLSLRWEQDRLEELADTILYLIDAQPEITAWQGAGCLILAGSDQAMAAALFDRAAADDFAALPHDFAWLVGMLVLAGGAARLGDAGRAATIAPHLAPYTDLVCWQGSCSYGPVAAVAADLADLCGDGDRGQRLRTKAAELRRSLAAAEG